jgi:hypothetical protein
MKAAKLTILEEGHKREELPSSWERGRGKAPMP